MRHTLCKACGRKMIMVKGLKGKEIPLDAEAHTYIVRGNLLEDTRAERTDAYVSHFFVCSDPNRFSGQREERPWPTKIPSRGRSV